MSERTTVRLPPELLASAKRKAAAEGRTLTSLIEEVLRVIVTESKAPQPQKRLQIPVSKATGGLQPGIDLTRMSDYHALEDEDYVRRFQRR